VYQKKRKTKRKRSLQVFLADNIRCWVHS